MASIALQNAVPKLVRVIGNPLPDGITARVEALPEPTAEKTGELFIEGTPTVFYETPQAYVLEVEAENGTTARYNLTLNVDAVAISFDPTTSTLTFVQEEPVDVPQAAAIFGSTPKTFVPAGLPVGVTAVFVASADAATNRVGYVKLSGSTEAVGSFDATITVTDYKGRTATLTLDITVEANIMQIYLDPNSGTVNMEIGQAYDQKLSDVVVVEPVAGDFTLTDKSFSRTMAQGESVDAVVSPYEGDTARQVVVVRGNVNPGLSLVLDNGVDGGQLKLVGKAFNAGTNDFEVAVLATNSEKYDIASLNVDVEGRNLTVVPGDRNIQMVKGEEVTATLSTWTGATSAVVGNVVGLNAGLELVINGSEIVLQGTPTATTPGDEFKIATYDITFTLVGGSTKTMSFEVAYRVTSSGVLDWYDQSPKIIGTASVEVLNFEGVVFDPASEDELELSVVSAPGLNFTFTTPEPEEDMAFPVLAVPPQAEGVYPYILKAVQGEKEVLSHGVIIVKAGWTGDEGLRTGGGVLAIGLDMIRKVTMGTFYIDTAPSTFNVYSDGTAKPSFVDMLFRKAANGGYLVQADVKTPGYSEVEGGRYYIVGELVDSGYTFCYTVVKNINDNGLIEVADENFGPHKLLVGKPAAVNILTVLEGSITPTNCYKVSADGSYESESGYVPGMQFEFRPVYDGVGMLELWLHGTPMEVGVYNQRFAIGANLGSNPEVGSMFMFDLQIEVTSLGTIVLSNAVGRVEWNSSTPVSQKLADLTLPLDEMVPEVNYEGLYLDEDSKVELIKTAARTYEARLTGQIYSDTLGVVYFHSGGYANYLLVNLQQQKVPMSLDRPNLVLDGTLPATVEMIKVTTTAEVQPQITLNSGSNTLFGANINSMSWATADNGNGNYTHTLSCDSVLFSDQTPGADVIQIALPPGYIDPMGRTRDFSLLLPVRGFGIVPVGSTAVTNNITVPRGWSAEGQQTALLSFPTETARPIWLGVEALNLTKSQGSLRVGLEEAQVIIGGAESRPGSYSVTAKYVSQSGSIGEATSTINVVQPTGVLVASVSSARITGDDQYIDGLFVWSTSEQLVSATQNGNALKTRKNASTVGASPSWSVSTDGVEDGTVVLTGSKGTVINIAVELQPLL